MTEEFLIPCRSKLSMMPVQPLSFVAACFLPFELRGRS